MMAKVRSCLDAPKIRVTDRVRVRVRVRAGVRARVSYAKARRIRSSASAKARLRARARVTPVARAEGAGKDREQVYAIDRYVPAFVDQHVDLEHHLRHRPCGEWRRGTGWGWPRSSGWVAARVGAMAAK